MYLYIIYIYIYIKTGILYLNWIKKENWNRLKTERELWRRDKETDRMKEIIEKQKADFDLELEFSQYRQLEGWGGEEVGELRNHVKTNGAASCWR